jgi:hypothetical protein
MSDFRSVAVTDPALLGRQISLAFFLHLAMPRRIIEAPLIDWLNTTQLYAGLVFSSSLGFDRRGRCSGRPFALALNLRGHAG